MGLFKSIAKGVGNIISGGALDAGENAQKAADIQSNAAQQAINQQQQLLSPFVQAATGIKGGGFDAAEYLRQNPDIAADPYFSLHPQEHYNQYGRAEGRKAPIVQAQGGGALQAYQDLLGLGTPGAQQQAIRGIESSPEYQALLRSGEEGILQNASATGGLRGGNTQGALAQFRPQLLSSLINQRLGQLGGLTQLGQASAAGQASSVANLLTQQGAAQAGGALVPTGLSALAPAIQQGGLLYATGGLSGAGGLFGKGGLFGSQGTL